MTGFAQPERAGSAEIQTVVAAVNLKSGSEASGPAGEVEEPNGPALALHELDAFKWFERADKDRGGGSSRVAHHIEHEVRAIVEKNVGVAGSEIHRTNARSRAAEVMPGWIAGRIGFRFHDAAAESARGQIVDDDFSEQEASEFDGVRRKFGAAEAPKRHFLGRGSRSVASRGHGLPGQRASSFCRSAEETRS